MLIEHECYRVVLGTVFKEESFIVGNNIPKNEYTYVFTGFEIDKSYYENIRNYKQLKRIRRNKKSK